MQDKFSQLVRNLPTKIIGRKICYYPLLFSTMDIAREKALNQEEEGTVVVAGHQSGGRGRKGRHWHSPEGNMSLSIICYPGEAQVTELIMCGALSVLYSIEELGINKAGIKWPNDILIDGKKVSGILVESQIVAGGVSYAVVGIGINANTGIGNLESSVILPTNLAGEKGQQVDLVRLAGEVILNFDLLYTRLKDGESLLDDWRSRLVTLGRNVTVERGSGTMKGLARDVNSDGNLLVLLESGEEIVISAGDVYLE